ncbi:hypothetical protein [Campylobacter sp. CCS1377]|uniref:Uncharacterized protein n=1 Tax=Campylobacter sp. CCS1377 TaxID=3158229 RepID=A0AAU7E7W1_9BACT|nr:hypothetical protein [Campylobacter jejuni]
MDDLKINPSNTTFESLQNTTKQKELSELKREEQDKVKVNDISSTKNSGFKVVFENKEGELLSLNLSEENFKNLQSHFASYTHIIARDDKSYRLNGEANEFIANWFEKVSNELFDPNSLSHNKQSTQKLNFKQKAPLESMRDLSVKNQNKLDQNANLEEKLNFSLEKDINFDGKVDEFDTKEPSLGEILSDLNKALNSTNSTQNTTTQEIKPKDKKDEKDLLELAKEKGLSALSADEQAKLKASNPAEFEKLQNKDLKNLKDNLSKDLKKQIQNGETILIDKKI